MRSFLPMMGPLTLALLDWLDVEHLGYRPRLNALTQVVLLDNSRFDHGIPTIWD